MRPTLSGIGFALVVPIAGLLLIRKYLSSFRWGRCRSKASMRGKTVLITGANSGLGKMTACELAKRDARVICACRNLVLGQEAIDDIRKTVQSGQLVLQHLDLASFSSIHSFADEILRSEPRIDVLINNAGLYGCPYSLTEDGFETQMGVNHLGQFLLTNLLVDRLKACSPSRVVMVCSSLYKYGKVDLEFLKKPDISSYNRRKGYTNSKLAMMLFGQELMEKLRSSDVGVYCVCPGMVWTNLSRHVKLPWWKKILFSPFAVLFVRRVIEGCQTILYCAIDENVKAKPDVIFANCKETPLKENAMDKDLRKQLWEISLQLTKQIN